MPLQVIPWSPTRLICVSGIHRERNHGSARSTRPITVHERTAKCISQLEPIIENPGNTRGAEQAFGRWFADGLYRGLVSSATQATHTVAVLFQIFNFSDCVQNKVKRRLSLNE